MLKLTQEKSKEIIKIHESIKQKIDEELLSTEPESLDSSNISSKIARDDGLFEELPLTQQDNEYIKTGYRINYQGFCPVLSSMFRLHNETVNVWTHFLGMFSFAVMALVIILIYPNTFQEGYKGQEQMMNSKLDVPDYLEFQLNNMTQEIESAEKSLLDDFKLRNMSIRADGELSHKEVIRKFVKRFAERVEQTSFILVFNLKYTIDQVVKETTILNSFNDFIVRYQQITQDYQAYVPELKRLNVLQQGLKQLDSMIVKVNSAIQNEPSLDADLVLTYVPRWPLLVHLFSACFCLGCSSIYHLFMIYGVRTSEILARLDYGGIAILVMGSCYSMILYSFSCSESFVERNILLGLITGFSIICFIITLLPAMNKAKFRCFRGTMFISLGLSAGIPIFYIKYFADQRFVDPNFTVVPWIVGGIIYIGGAIMFIARIPERFYPNTFDLLGSSHNIHHMTVLIGCFVHFNEALNCYNRRKEIVCPLHLNYSQFLS